MCHRMRGLMTYRSCGGHKGEILYAKINIHGLCDALYIYDFGH